MKYLFSATLAVVLTLIPHTLMAQLTPTSSEQLETLSNLIQTRKGGLGAREAMGFILKAVQLHQHEDQIDAALSIDEELQDRDPSSPSYGNLTWYLHDLGKKPNDLNAVQFTMENAILIWNLYRDALSPKQQARLKKLIELGLLGVQSQPVNVNYANIFILKTWNLIAIGEAFGKSDVADKGYAMLQEWLAYTSHHGIREYMSPTYLGVDLDGLALIHNYAQRPEGKTDAEAGLKYLWLSARANWFDPAGRLGGSHARDYDYLDGHGYLDKQAVDWGWIPSATLLGSELYANQELTNWKPSDPALEAAATVVPRNVWLRFDDKPCQQAMQYIGQTVSIGVGGMSSGPEDKVFAINFAGDPKMPMASYVLDGRGDPYGHKLVLTAGGHIKAHHLVPFVASAQAGPNVLLFSAYGPFIHQTNGEPVPQSLNSNLLLPSAATVWQGDALMQPGVPLADIATPMFIRYDKTVIGLRVVSATDDTGKPVLPTLQRDGDKWQAQRITWLQAAQAPQGEVHLLFLATAAENLDDAAFAEFRHKFAALQPSFTDEDGKVTAHVTALDNSVLSLEANPSTDERKSSTPDYDGILRVNGTELGLPLLTPVLKNP